MRVDESVDECESVCCDTTTPGDHQTRPLGVDGALMDWTAERAWQMGSPASEDWDHGASPGHGRGLN